MNGDEGCVIIVRRQTEREKHYSDCVDVIEEEKEEPYMISMCFTAVGRPIRSWMPGLLRMHGNQRGCIVWVEMRMPLAPRQSQ